MEPKGLCRFLEASPVAQAGALCVRSHSGTQLDLFRGLRHSILWLDQCFFWHAGPQYFVGVRIRGQRTVGVREAHRNELAIAASQRAFRRAGIAMVPICASDRYNKCRSHWSRAKSQLGANENKDSSRALLNG